MLRRRLLRVLKARREQLRRLVRHAADSELTNDDSESNNDRSTTIKTHYRGGERLGFAALLGQRELLRRLLAQLISAARSDVSAIRGASDRGEPHRRHSFVDLLRFDQRRQHHCARCCESRQTNKQTNKQGAQVRAAEAGMSLRSALPDTSSRARAPIETPGVELSKSQKNDNTSTLAAAFVLCLAACDASFIAPLNACSSVIVRNWRKRKSRIVESRRSFFDQRRR